jgi:hypothetical protein
MRPLFARRRDAGPAKSHRIQPEQQLALVLVGGLSSLSIICPADNANAQRELNSHGPFANGPYEKQSPVRVVAVTSPWTASQPVHPLQVLLSLSVIPSEAEGSTRSDLPETAEQTGIAPR